MVSDGRSQLLPVLSLIVLLNDSCAFSVRDQYETHPYPPVEDSDLQVPLILQSPSHLVEVLRMQLDDIPYNRL